MPEQLYLDWSSAEVTEGTLTVAFSERPPKRWRDAFERTAALLSHGKWQTCLSPKKGTVELSPVALGDEERVRELLQGAVLEANATLVGEDELFARGQADEAAPEAGSEPSVDEQLTESFRAFAHLSGRVGSMDRS